MKRNELLKLGILMFLAIGQLACPSPNTTSNRDDLFGNPNQSGNGGGDPGVILNPDPFAGGTVNSPPGGGGGAVCEPIAIFSQELEALVGKPLAEQISVSGNCGQVVCSLLSGPDWPELSADCLLSGTPPYTSDSFGIYELEVKACSPSDPTHCVQQKLSLRVGDDPKIILSVEYIGPGSQLKNLLPDFRNLPNFSDGVWKVNNVNNNEEAIDDEGQLEQEITLGRHALYFRIQGAAESYDVTMTMANAGDEGKLSIQDTQTKNYYQLVPTGAGEADIPGITLTALYNSSPVAQIIFNLQISPNPCDKDLKVRVHKICQYIGDKYECISMQGSQEKKVDVKLGSKDYQVVFEAMGGEGPYQWSKESVVKTNPEVGPCESGDESLTCAPKDMLKENPNWQEIKLAGPEFSDEERINKTYFKLSTDFGFPDHDLPWNFEGDNEIFENLKVTAKIDACPTANGEVMTAAFTHRLNYRLPKEGTASITVNQHFHDIWDTNNNRSWMTIRFKKDVETKVDAFTYNLRNLQKCVEKKENSYTCQNSDPDSKDPSPDSGYIDEIKHIELLFEDKFSCDHVCHDCDHDELDYDLLSLKLRSDYRYFNYYDTDENCEGTMMVMGQEVKICDIDDDVVHSPCGGGFSDGGLVGDTAWELYNLTPANANSSEYGIWKPRRRPHYPSD